MSPSNLLRLTSLALVSGLLCVPGAAHADEPSETPRARVHIRAPQPSYLYRRTPGTDDFVTVCQTPCDAEMALGDTYKIGGRGFRTTREFTLDASPGGSVDLTVDGSSWTGIIVGGSITLIGAITAYVGSLFALSVCTSDVSNTACRDQHNAGVVLLAAGGLGIAAGLAIVLPSLKTDLAQQKDRPSSNDAFVRTPSWRSASSTTDGGGRAPMLPMLPFVYEARF